MPKVGFPSKFLIVIGYQKIAQNASSSAQKLTIFFKRHIL